MTVPSIRRLMVAGSAALLLLGLVAPGVGATIAVRDSDTFSDEFSYSCGSDVVDVSVAGSFDFMARAGKGKDDSAFFGHNHYEGVETHVRRSDDATITVAFEGLLQEGRATRVSGNVFEFSAVDAFRIRITDEDGDLLLFDRGSVRFVIQFDTRGDDQVGGDFVAFIGEKFNGPHPLLTTDLCDLFD